MYRDADIMDYVYDVLGNDSIYDCNVAITIGRDVIYAKGLDSYSASQLVASAVSCCCVDQVDFDAGKSYGRVVCCGYQHDYELAMERHGVFFDDDSGEWVGRNGDMAHGRDDRGDEVLLVCNGGCR